MDKILVGIGGVLASLFVLWFFFGKRERAVKVREASGRQELEIVVDGGYTPDVIEVKEGVPARLNFFRKDPSSCLEEVVIGDFNVKKRLELNEKTLVEFTPTGKGEHDFSCGMGMFHGKIIVR
ncbi:MAG: cupredoxin domain-containing protein [Actinomycetota bacterium]